MRETHFSLREDGCVIIQALNFGCLVSTFVRLYAIFDNMGLFWEKDKLQIIAFRSYGTDSHLFVRGRTLEDEEIDLAEKGFFHLLKNTWKRFETDEMKHALVSVTLPDKRVVNTKSDDEGYYLLDESITNMAELTNEEGWLHLKISYADTNLKREIKQKNLFSGEMLIPSKNANFGVISDIDDTILHTGVVSSLKWRVVMNIVFKNVMHRKPLEGMANFYHLLHQGRSGKCANPIFYVSHSPWNLYRYLELFLKANKFPKGPIVLRSMSTLWNGKNEKPQKQKEILNILRTYPALSFILIGDAGEYDADIYIEISKMYPKQIKAIYLRAVNDKKRMQRVESLFSDFKITPVFLMSKSEDAIQHAREHKFICT